MPTTRGAEKRALVGASAATPESSKRAKREQAEDKQPQPQKALSSVTSEAARKHKSVQLEAFEVFDKKDWDKIAKQVQLFRRHPDLGRLLIPFHFNVRKWAARIPAVLAKQELAPLTNLTRLCLHGPGLSMADTDPLPAGVQLPQLKIVDFGGAKACLETIATFMPNVQHLSAHHISIHLQPVDAAGSGSSSSSSSGPAVCKSLTHLSCHTIRVYKPASPAATAAAVAAALPQLHVLSNIPQLVGFPEFTEAPAHSRKGSTIYYTPGERYHVYDYATCLKKLRAIRYSGHDALWHTYRAKEQGAAAVTAHPDWGLQSLTGLKDLRVLWLTSLGPGDLHFAQQVSQLQQLTQVCFNLRSRVITANVQQLLQSLLQLPKLATLAMPLHLLCTEGCAASAAAMQSSLNQIAAKPSVKQLVLIDAKRFGSWGWDDTGDAGVKECDHRLSWAEGIKRVKAAAATVAAELRLQVMVVEVERNQDVGDTNINSFDWGHPVWGVFGPHESLFTEVEW